MEISRRQFLTTGGSAILGATAIHNITRQPAVALDFSIESTPDFKPSNVDKMLINFNKFKLEPNYLKNTGDEATLKITMSMDNGPENSKSMNMKLSNKETVTKEDIDKILPLELTPNTDESAIRCEMRIKIDHADVTDSYTSYFVISKGITIVDDFESGNISSQIWDNRSQNGTNPYVSTPAYEGSNAVQIDADPGTNTAGELVTTTGYQGSIYSTRLQKKRDGGGQNSINYAVVDNETGEKLRITSSSYSSPHVKLTEYDSNGNEVNNWTIGSELGTNNWFEVKYVFNQNNLDIKWGSLSLNDITTNHDFDMANLKIKLRANGWGSGHKMHVAFDNVRVE